MQKYRADIDGLRAIAVVPVVLFHAKVPGFSGGFVGVDVFFVISGYLITSIIFTEISQARFSILSFYERRIRRILPALFAVLIGSGIAAYFLLLPEEMKAFGRSVVATTLFASNLLFWREADYFDATAETKPLLHTWSLAVEEQFYIFFPVALALCFRFMPRYLRSMVVMTAILSFVLCVVAQKLSPVASFYLPVTRIWELMIGAILALGVIPLAKTDLQRSLMGGAGLAAILAGVFLYDARTPFPGVSALLPTIGAALVIHAGANGRHATAALLSLRPVVFVGLVSYSFYLWHWPVLVFGRMFANSELTPLEIVAAVIASFALAVLSWHYVERPFRNRTLDAGRKILFSATFSLMTAFCLLGITTVATSGIPQRFQNNVLKIAATENEADELRKRYKCASFLLIKSDVFGPCSIGQLDGISPSIAIWGDSHAIALKPMFDASLKELGLAGVLISVPGCVPAMNLERINYQRSCLQSANAVFDLLKDSGIKKVILIGYWQRMLYEEDTIFQGRTSSDDETRIANLRQSIRLTSALFHENGVSVAMMMPLPGAKNNVPTTLARSVILGRSADLEFTRQEYGDVLEILREISTDPPAPSPYFIDIASLVCPNRCDTRSGDHILYIDDNHPSAYLTSILRKTVQPQLKIFAERTTPLP